MKIGIVTVWKERGAGYVSQQIVNSLHSQGAEVFVFSRGGEPGLRLLPEASATSVTVATEFDNFITTYISKKELENWMLNHQLEVVIFNEQHWWEPVVWCRDLGITVGSYIDYYKANTIDLFGLYDFLICNTKRHFEAFSWHPGAIYIPWGTNIDQFQPPASSNFGSSKVRFLHSAGMSPFRKGTDLLIEAASCIEDEFELLIHSQTVLPEINDSRIKIIRGDLNASDFYKLGDVYVYPSRLDGIGLSLPEAVASGLAVIVPDSEPMTDFCMQDFAQVVSIQKTYSREDGYYWPVREVSVEELALAMEFFIGCGQLTLAKEKARSWATDNLDWSKNSQSLKQEILKRKSLAPFHSIKLGKRSLQDFRAHGLNKLQKVFARFPRSTAVAKRFYSFLS